jgi:hypothetical protein
MLDDRKLLVSVARRNGNASLRWRLDQTNSRFASEARSPSIPELQERCASDNGAWTLADGFQTFLTRVQT